MIEVNETYMSLSKETRQAHLDLTTSCLERGGDSRNHKGTLAQYLNSSIPNGRILLCHACHNGKCSNPQHLYWGTDKENSQDAIANGAKSFHQKAKDKYGDSVVDIYKRNGAAGGRKAKIKKLIRLIFSEDPIVIKNKNGQMWITDGTFNKRVNVNSKVPDGWTKGRSI